MLKLNKMKEQDFQHYLDRAIPEYAKEKVAAGAWQPDTALHQAQEAYRRLLPAGLDTEGHYLFQIVKDEEMAGYIWIAKDNMNPVSCFIYDFEVYTQFRGTGIGTKALSLATEYAKILGFQKLRLHVFASNHAAIHLYEKSGFFSTDITMEKLL